MKESIAMIVSELMTRNSAAVRPDQTLADAAQLMWDCDCGTIPAVQDDRVVGMVTDRDICMATWSRGDPPGAIRVVDTMSRDVVRCAPQDTIVRAESIMRENRIRRLPVTDSEGRLLGILSLADIARATEIGPNLASDRDVSADGLAKTLASICAMPRSTTTPAQVSSAR